MADDSTNKTTIAVPTKPIGLKSILVAAGFVAILAAGVVFYKMIKK